MRNAMPFVVVLLAATLLSATVARAQTAPAPTNGPLVFERIHDGWVLAPDFKVTDVDNRTGELAGVYGGRLIEGTLLIGGAAYWLANSDRDFQLRYGGLVVGWQSPELGRVRFGGRGLVGAGQATLGFDVTPPGVGILQTGGPQSGNVPPGRGDIRFGAPEPRAQVPVPAQRQAPTIRVLGRDTFLVFEPQANVSLRVTSAIGINFGVGYRETAQADILRNRLDGATASLAVQIGW